VLKRGGGNHSIQKRQRLALPLQIRHQSFPSVSKYTDPKINADGDVYFGPEMPAGQESNWILTREGKPFFMMFRFYGPEERAVDGSWVLNDIEQVK
jgi:hypothetical protein